MKDMPSWRQVAEVSKPKGKKLATTHREIDLALLSMFAMCDDVFTEDDALSPEKRQMSLGRIYEEWKRCREKLDPEFDRRSDERPKRWLPKQVRDAKAESSSRRATASTKSSTARKSISATKQAARSGKTLRKRSATPARRGTRA